MRPEAEDIKELVARVLAPYEQRPDAEGVARLTDDLITVGKALHAAVSEMPTADRTERAGAALIEWAYFVEVGPLSHGSHANWNYARGLARIIQGMASVPSPYSSGAR
ncbi:DUF6415 family natural product biosynthesis protein [Streptomyces sp. NPDC056401]|uniref:DUF6415 family natural product biosynthesis protein n=1 Tax=Streptomyces sp. NPDC056401 TaxID=3345809 RepID=UPI0035DEBFA9